MKPNWKREVEKSIEPVLRELARKRTRQFDNLIANYRDGDVNSVKSELVRIFRADGGHITEPELSQYAKAIVAGQRIVIEVGPNQRR